VTSSPSSKLKPFVLFALFTVLGTGCDLATKQIAESALLDTPGQSVSVLEPVLELRLTYNTGTAFSFVADLGNDGRFGMGAFAMLIALGLFIWVYRTREVTRLQAMGFGALAAGAVGNGWDRMFRMTPSGETGVVDFIQINYPWGGHWPIFNVADVLLLVAVVLIVVDAFKTPKEPSTKTPPTPSPR